MGTPPSPAARAIRASLGRRPHLPGALYACAAIGLALAGIYVAVYVWMRAADPTVAAAMLRMYALTLGAGRETAMFDALHGPDALPPATVFALSVLDDVGTLLLTVALVGWCYEALRRHRAVRRVLLRLERQALRHRAIVRRWGLAGLAAFYFLPGFGSGVLAATVLGVLGRVPPGRLATVLAASSVAVDAFWTVALARAAAAAPEADWVGLLPLAVLAAVAAAAIVSVVRDHAQRHLLVLELGGRAAPAHEGRMASWGLRREGDLLVADTRQLAPAAGVADPARLASVAALLQLDGMEPQVAAALEARGVAGVTDLARVEPALVQAALAEAGLPASLVQAQAWRGAAEAVVASARLRWRTA